MLEVSNSPVSLTAKVEYIGHVLQNSAISRYLCRRIRSRLPESKKVPAARGTFRLRVFGPKSTPAVNTRQVIQKYGVAWPFCLLRLHGNILSSVLMCSLHQQYTGVPVDCQPLSTRDSHRKSPPPSPRREPRGFSPGVNSPFGLQENAPCLPNVLVVAKADLSQKSNGFRATEQADRPAPCQNPLGLRRAGVGDIPAQISSPGAEDQPVSCSTVWSSPQALAGGR